MEKKKEYRGIFDLNAVILCKKDLFELEKILVENPETDKIDIELSFDNTTIYAESFEELLDNTEIPLFTDKLEIKMRRWIEKEENKSISCGVSLKFCFNFIDCQIHSSDETWFLGTKIKIENFFSSKKPWYLFLKKTSNYWPAIAIILFFYGGYLLGEKKYFEMILPIISSILISILILLEYKQILFPFVKIYLKKRTSTNFGLIEWCAIIGALSSLALIVQIVSKLFK